MVVDNKAGVLDILDTTGQEEFMLLRDQWIGDSEGFLIIYSITSRNSFDQIKQFRDHIYRVREDSSKTKKIPILIVGNKNDLEDSRAVPTHEGAELAKQLNCEFIECSAKTRENIDEAFTIVVRMIRAYRGEKITTPTVAPLNKSSGVEQVEKKPGKKCSIL
jgi:GTPase KRas